MRTTHILTAFANEGARNRKNLAAQAAKGAQRPEIVGIDQGGRETRITRASRDLEA